MRLPHIDDYVRLTQDLPELSLRQGAVGVVCSTWFSPHTRYEVQFTEVQGGGGDIRALLRPEQVAVDGVAPDGEEIEDSDAIAMASAAAW